MPPSPTPSALLPLETQCLLVADPTRIAILRELCKGEPLPVIELARRLGRKRTAIAKHLHLLRTTGVAAQGFGRLYRIAPAFQPAPDSPVLDFGELTLRISPPA